MDKFKWCPQIFNHLISVFGFAFRNLPESIIEGRITKKGRVEYYFKAFGSIAVLFIEIKLTIGTAKERLDAIAQIIAECDCLRSFDAKFYIEANHPLIP
jgi:hypothetical protein